jgi:hypothetical protein
MASSTKNGFNPKDLNIWHKTRVALPKYWSCDWPRWDNAREFHDRYMFTTTMREIFCIDGEVEPLAVVPRTFNPDATFVFFAGGLYYWYTYGGLKRFEGPFAGTRRYGGRD